MAATTYGELREMIKYISSDRPIVLRDPNDGQELRVGLEMYGDRLVLGIEWLGEV
jgi:hypothetical protein